MKALLISILLFSLNCNAQKTWEFADKLQSDYFRMDSIFCYMESVKFEQSISIKIRTVRQPILSPLYVTTNLGSFILNFDHVDKFKWNTYTIYLRRSDQLKSISTGILYLEFYTGTKWERINVNSNLTKLINYASKKD
jgi:hypothetical protein